MGRRERRGSPTGASVLIEVVVAWPVLILATGLFVAIVVGVAARMEDMRRRAASDALVAGFLEESLARSSRPIGAVGPVGVERLAWVRLALSTAGRVSGGGRSVERTVVALPGGERRVNVTVRHASRGRTVEVSGTVVVDGSP
jgi:hypothetical protein